MRPGAFLFSEGEMPEEKKESTNFIQVNDGEEVTVKGELTTGTTTKDMYGAEYSMMPQMGGMNYSLDFEEIDAQEEMEDERQTLMKRAAQFMRMLESAKEMADLETIKAGMTRVLNKRNKKEIEEVEEKQAMKTEDGVKYSSSDFAYTPDKEKPSTWKLRLAQGKPGNITRSQLGAASAALSPGGFRGNRVQLPSDAVAGVKRRIRSEYEKLGVDKENMPASIKEFTSDNEAALTQVKEWYESEKEVDFSLLKQQGSFDLWKEGDRLRWLAVYSNKYRDNDNPPEIISEASHKNFVKMVDEGEAAYPELWYWHIPGTRFGQADFVAYDNSGFAIASGLIDSGMEEIAKNISKTPDQLVSHGMPSIFIERDNEDKSIITNHITTEISVLPAEMAANKLTSFLVEAKGMSLPENKAQKLDELGFNVEAIQDGLAAKGKAAEDAGIESKQTETVVTETVVEEVIEVDLADYVTRKEITELVGEMANEIKALKAENQELRQLVEGGIEKQLQETPAASLTSMFQSAIGSEDAKVDGRTRLAKEGPKEDEPLAAIPGVPPFISQLANSSRNGWN